MNLVMKIILWLVSLLLSWYCEIGEAQLTVEVRRYNLSSSSLFSSLLEGNYTVVSTFTDPQGFSDPFAWFMKIYANIPPEGISGLLYYPNPRGECSGFEPPPYLPNVVNATWFAIVHYYPACTLERSSALRDAGYKLLITFGYRNHRRDLDVHDGKRVEATEFPILLLPEEYVDYLVTLNVTSLNGDSLLVVFVSADPTTQTVIQVAVVVCLTLLILLVPIALCICICACVYCDTRKERDNGREGGSENYEMPILQPRERVVREYNPEVETNTTRCTICMDDFNTGDSMEVLPCDHMFHSACIEQWLTKNCVCPVCRNIV